MSHEPKKKPGQFQKSRENHLRAQKNSDELKKIRAGDEGTLYVDGKYMRCRKPREEGVIECGREYHAIVKIRSGKWIIAQLSMGKRSVIMVHIESNRNKLSFRPDRLLGHYGIGSWRMKHIQGSDIIAEVVMSDVRCE